jgi:DNA-binding LacI/PurR family transcriptional regulator
MEIAGLRVAGEYIVEAAFEERRGLEAMQALLGRDPRPTAVLVWSFAAAIGAFAAARRSGVAVPEQMSVVAFHDIPLAEYLDPPVTTVRMPLGEMAERSVEVVIGLIEGRPASNVVIKTAPELVERGSTGPAPEA